VFISGFEEDVKKPLHSTLDALVVPLSFQGSFRICFAGIVVLHRLFAGHAGSFIPPVLAIMFPSIRFIEDNTLSFRLCFAKVFGQTFGIF
jgi:hypothetical protein